MSKFIARHLWTPLLLLSFKRSAAVQACDALYVSCLKDYKGMVQHWEGRMTLEKCASTALTKQAPFYGVTDTLNGQGNCVVFYALPPPTQKTADAECQQLGWTNGMCLTGKPWRVALYTTQIGVPECAASYVGCSVDKEGLWTQWLGKKLLSECAAAAANRNLPFYGVTAGIHETQKTNCIAWATLPPLGAPDKECREMFWNLHSCPLGWTWRIAVYRTVAPFTLQTTTAAPAALYNIGTRTTTPWITVTTSPFAVKYDERYNGLATQHVAAWPQVGQLYAFCLLLIGAIVAGVVIRGVRRRRIENYSPMAEECVVLEDIEE